MYRKQIETVRIEIMRDKVPIPLKNKQNLMTMMTTLAATTELACNHPLFNSIMVDAFNTMTEKLSMAIAVVGMQEPNIRALIERISEQKGEVNTKDNIDKSDETANDTEEEIRSEDITPDNIIGDTGNEKKGRKFEKGHCVVARRNICNGTIKRGAKGIVIGYASTGHPQLLVEWEKGFADGHNGHGIDDLVCKDGHGLYVEDEDVRIWEG